eukprot:4827805-Prymnesium_polylepis.1
MGASAPPAIGRCAAPASDTVSHNISHRCVSFSRSCADHVGPARVRGAARRPGCKVWPVRKRSCELGAGAQGGGWS